MSQHMWLVLTDVETDETFYIPYESINHLEIAALEDEELTVIHLRNEKSIKVSGTPEQIFGALAQQLAAQGETFVAAIYPQEQPPA
jgi:hypothetical protein